MSTDAIVRLKVTLDDVKPAVMRRLEVPLNLRLDRLHLVLQAAIGWTNSHLWEIRVRDIGWGPPQSGWGLGGDLPLKASRQACSIDRIDEAVLALLYLGLHDRSRAWKGFDWDALDRLHKKGFISDPVSKAKSVTFTEDGLREAERLFRELFAARG